MVRVAGRGDAALRVRVIDGFSVKGLSERDLGSRKGAHGAGGGRRPVALAHDDDSAPVLAQSVRLQRRSRPFE